jgi:DNA-binding NtrC family response regulator
MTAPHILVVDDEPDIRELVKEILEDEHYSVTSAADGAAARRAYNARRPDLILLDIWMPDVDGITLLKEWQGGDEPMPPVVIMSGHGTVETAVEATRLGAYDFLEKPLSMAKLLITLRHALDDQNLRREASGLRRHLQPLSQPLGKSEAMSRLREQATQLAGSDATVLLSGEPGVGKRLLARFIHDRSARRNGPFVEVGMATLTGSEGAARLFGEERNGQPVIAGLLEQACGGTLFLNEVGGMEAPLQAQLAQALAARTLRRCGGIATVTLDLRIIASSSRNLTAEVRHGHFHEGLFYQLNVVPVTAPPLREHRDDLLELLAYYVDYFVESEGLTYRSFSVAAQNRLRHHSWPGNVREFINLVHHLLILGQGAIVESNEIEQALGASQLPSASEQVLELDFDLPLRQARELFEKAYFEYQLRVTDGNVSQVAKKAGIERTHLYRKMKSLGINPKEEIN